jgi:hypothetical protein
MLAHYTNCHLYENKSGIAAQDVYTIRYTHTIQFKDKDFKENLATATEEIRQLGKAGCTKYDKLDFNAT